MLSGSPSVIGLYEALIYLTSFSYLLIASCTLNDPGLTIYFNARDFSGFLKFSGLRIGLYSP